MITKVSFDFDLGIPIIPDDIKERVRQGEQIDVEILPQTSGFVQNALKWDVAGLWVDGGRIPFGDSSEERHTRDQYARQARSGARYFNQEGDAETFKYDAEEPLGRWPANLLFDEVAAAMLDEQSGERPVSGAAKTGRPAQYNKERSGVTAFDAQKGNGPLHNDTGTAARFFYTAKSSPRERNLGCEDLYWRKEGKTFIQVTKEEWSSLSPKKRAEGNIHATVKPIELMRYLTRLTRTPTGGTVLDPFMGSGTGGIACLYEDRDFIGIDNDIDSFVVSGMRIEGHRKKIERKSG